MEPIANRKMVAGGNNCKIEMAGNAVAVTGDNGTSVVGCCGFAISGKSGISSAKRFGTAISGENGISKTDDFGISIVGDSGMAFTRNHGLASAGKGGVIQFLRKEKIITGIIGTKNLKPNTLYYLFMGKFFVEADSDYYNRVERE